MTCNNAHFNYPRSASISMQIKEVAILLGCIEPRCEEKDALKNETGGEVKKEGKKKTRREMEWNNEEERKSEKNGNVGERKWRKKKGGNLRDRGMEDGVQAWWSFPSRLETREFCILYVYLRYRGWRSRLRVYFFRQECFCSKRHVSKIVGSMLGGKGEL